MRTVAVTVLVVSLFASSLSPVRAGQAPERRSDTGVAPAEASAVLSTYCAGCHNGVMRSPSGAVLDVFDLSTLADNPDLWTRAYRQLEAGTMPPVGARRPDRPASHAVLRRIEDGLGARMAPPADATSQQIAERLAALLWSSAPDVSLQQEAARGALTDMATLQQQVRRMLEDERARAFVERFFFAWLGLDQLAKADANPALFPEYDRALRDGLARETELFLLDQLRHDRDPIDLWTANETFVNARLARHYGLPEVIGNGFQRVVTSPERAGLLGQGSIMMALARLQPGQTVAYTSPAARSIWVRLHFLGAPPPRPFPGAQPVKPELPITPQTRTLPAEPCVSCHRNFFPLGYALENFDPIGRWRTSDQVGPVDASGALVDGTPTDGVVALRNALLQRPDAFRTTITEKLVLFAAGRQVAASRMSPETLIRARQTLNAVEEVRWSSLIAAIVRATPLP
jgi:hypothetical protein